MDRQQLRSVVGGLIGGGLGTTMMLQTVKASDRLPEAIRPPAVREDPGAYVVRRLEERRGRPLPERAHQRAARGAHWIYGIGWSTLFSAIAPRLKLTSLGRAIAAGAAFGTSVWAIGYLGWLPRAGLVAPARRQGLGHHAGVLAAHVGYGILAALPIYAANRTAARR